MYDQLIPGDQLLVEVRKYAMLVAVDDDDVVVVDDVPLTITPPSSSKECSFHHGY